MSSSPSHRFGFLMFPAFEELDLIGPWEMATMWRDYAGGPTCVSVSERGGDIACAKGLATRADHSFETCPPLDYLLVPGGIATRQEVNNERLVGWLAERGERCQHVLSVCTGSFLLQAAGLLQGRTATTHWLAREAFAALPDVTLTTARWHRDGNVWTSAGVSAGMDLLLAFIAALDGEEAAETVQRGAEYYPDGRIYGRPPAA